MRHAHTKEINTQKRKYAMEILEAHKTVAN